ncbi:MAG: hypothetical protein IPL53_11695 [Ignavibacteria bacterium]|nr:hypothetical protein [Ignavibacteria bacterium]
MLTIFTLELYNGSKFKKESDSGNASNFHSGIENNPVEQSEISEKKYRQMENFFMLFPILVMIIAIIIMSILYKIFY